jgi:hypothetical protein
MRARLAAAPHSRQRSSGMTTTPESPAVEPGEILTMPTGDVVVGVPTAEAVVVIPEDEE